MFDIGKTLVKQGGVYFQKMLNLHKEDEMQYIKGDYR